jgi:hypothetical protein
MPSCRPLGGIEAVAWGTGTSVQHLFDGEFALSDLTVAIAAVNNLIGQYRLTRDELVDVLGGPIDGGPNGDGWYPVTLASGDEVMRPSLARAVAILGAMGRRIYMLRTDLLAAPTDDLEYGDTAAVDASDAGTHGAPDPPDTPNSGIYVWTDGGESADYWKWYSNLLLIDLVGLVEAAQEAVAEALAASVEFAVSAPRAVITLTAAGAASPTDQSTTITATLNRDLEVEWQVYDGAGVEKTPTTDFLSAATGDAVTITAAQVIAAAGATKGVRIKATVEFGARVIDRWWSLALVRDGATGSGGSGGGSMIPLVSGALPGPDFLADDFGRPILIPYVESD